MPDIQATLQTFLDEHPDIEIFEVMLKDLCGGLRGKWVTRDKIHKVMAGQLKMPLSTLAFDIWGRDGEEWVFATGDGDGYCRPDIRTLVPTPWAERPSGQVLMSMAQIDGMPCRYDPRMIITGLVERLAEHGLTPVMATEMEFHLLQAEMDPSGLPQHTQSDRLGGTLAAGQTYGMDAMAEQAPVLHAIRDACVAQGLPVDTLIKESAPSQYEINLYHTADALLAADQAVMLQRAIKGVARQHGYRATFMAKPFADIPGNGMHVHCSLQGADGGNAFDDGTDQGSPLLRQAIAGCLDMLQESMLLFAPNLNSYRRFQRGTHAPLAPTWGYENRTVAIRVPADAPSARRIEHRVAGADANPYLVIAGILAGILHGIEGELEPPTPLEGNAYDQVPPTLPRYWPDALAYFQGSEVVRARFGEDFQKVFSILKQQELDEHDRQVTVLEYEGCL